MPSQHDYLVGATLREGLRQHTPAAEVRLVQLYNRGRKAEGRITEPIVSGDYRRYDARLLALLWALAGNDTALLVLARQHGWTGPGPPAYVDMPEPLLLYLWAWGRDADSLRALWTRRGRLPVEDIDGLTPEAVLGFLWWSERQPEARDELFRRYHLGGAGDVAQDRALTLLLVVDRWDYERYPTLGSLLAVSAARRRIDAGRRRARAAGAEQQAAEDAARGEPRPEARAEDRDYLERNVPLELRALHKIKENSEEQPLDLTAEELDYLAGRNLDDAGCEETDGPPRARERVRIVAWMARHPEPSEEEIRECLPWFRQSGLARQTRAWRLRWRADENDRLLAPLLAGRGDEVVDLACRVQENMDELARRIDEAGRNPRPDDRGPVLLFTELTEAARRLRDALEAQRPNNGRRAGLGAWQANVQAFQGAFPILAKLAACRRLACWLLHVGLPPDDVPLFARLMDWLDGGAWLATFGRDDRIQSDLFGRRLLELRGRFEGDVRAALDLLLLWLQATQEPGEAGHLLHDADRAWWLSHDRPRAWPDDLAGLANELAAAATQGDWRQAAARAGLMSRRLLDCPDEDGWPVREFQDCLRRLSRCR